MSPLAMFDTHYPTHGHPFAWAKCTVCGDSLHTSSSPRSTVSPNRKRSTLHPTGARDHTTCHPAGKEPTTIAEQRREEYFADKQFGQYEDAS